MDRLVAPFSIERKQVSEAGTFEGFASTFGNVDLGGDVILAGAFTKSLAEWSAKGELPAMLFGHDMDEPIGEFTAMEQGDQGLFVKGKLWSDGPNPVPKAVQAHRMLTGTGPKGMSIGFITKEAERQANGIRVIKEIELLETSIVVFGMNPKARITDAKLLYDEGGTVLSRKHVERALRSTLGLSASQAKAFTAEGLKGLRNVALSDDDMSDELDPDALVALATLTKTMKGLI